MSALGYAGVPPGLVFRGMAVLHPGAVVLLMEMDSAAIDRAPEPEAGREAVEARVAGVW